jgi:general secretion pathway protein H
VTTTRTAERGFTLVELLVVIGVLGLLAAAAVPAIESVTGANARKAAGELAGTMRYLFDTAALRPATCRLAIDMGERTFWPECARGRAGVAKDPEREADRRDAFPRERDEEVEKLLAGAEYGAFEDRLARKRELPGAAAFGKIHVEGRRRGVEEGIVHVHFFAGGRAQRAFVPVRDGSHVYTVVLEPFTGRARVVNGEVEVRE